VLPVWIAAGFLVYYNYQSRRALTEQRMLETARALTMVVDRELANMQASLSALATTPSLTSGDLPAFYRQAWLVLEAHPSAYILLADATGQELLNTIAPFGAPLPKYSVSDAVRQVFATGRPVITDAFKGAWTGRLMISVHFPVFRNGRVVYDLGMNVPADRFATVLLQQHLPPEWVGSILDSNQVVVTRTRLAEKFVGRQAGPVLWQRMRESAESTAEVINFERIPTFDSFSRSATSGWTVVIGVPKAIMMAGIWHWLWWTIAGTALLSLTGVALALLMARRIAGAIQGLIAPALALGRGESVAIGRLELTEFDEAVESLVTASQLIQQRAVERERAEAARRETEDLKRLNAELERSEAEARTLATELAAILDAVPAVTFITHDPKCQRITSNRAAYDLLRLPPGTNTSRSAPDSEGPSNYRILRDGRALSPDELPVQLAAATGREVRDCEYTIAFDDGTSRSIFGNAVPLLDERGRVRGAVGAFIDITERKRAETQLQATADRLKAILEHAPVGIVTNDRECHLLEPNAAYQRICGYSAEELIGKKFTDHTHPDDIAKTLQSYEQLGSNKLQSYEMEKRYIRKDGKIIWIRVTASRLNEETNIGIIEDITARKQAEQQLRTTADRLKAILDNAPVGVSIVDRDGRIVESNAAYQRITGFSGDELIGMNFKDITHPEDLPRNLKLFNEIATSPTQVFAMEKRYICKDGRTIWVRVIGSGLSDDQRIGIIEDVTENKWSQQALAESEERLRTIVELAPDGIFVVSDQGQIIEVNQAACKQLGYTRSQLLQLKIFDFISPRFARRVVARLRGQVSSGSYESAHIRADGVEVPVELSVTKIMFHGQSALLGIARDISDRKRAEEQREKLEQQLRQAQKMEAIGRLAGGIAHDFNNLLMVIQSHAERLQKRFPDHDALQRNTREIMKAADRAASLTRQMLAFSRKQVLSPVVFDLNAVINDTAKMLSRLIGEDIELRVSAAESLWAIKADADQIVQVLMNLCVNARDAMPQGGTLTIATGNVNVEEGSVGRQSFVSPGKYVSFSVTDTGMGISKEVQGQIFDPFFTTKEVGKGTGLGLSTVYGIVKQSGGYISVDSELGQGACFTVFLPGVNHPIISKISAQAEAQPPGIGTILVAEDEEALRETICDCLRSLGYMVLEAGSGQQALAVASQHEGNIDLLVTDLVMPGMSGRELAQMLGSLRLDLKTIYMSGYADDAVLRHGIPELGAAFLQKPFYLDTLARKVRDTLGRTETVR
jgi:PAS domain S-box-containing protein